MTAPRRTATLGMSLRGGSGLFDGQFLYTSLPELYAGRLNAEAKVVAKHEVAGISFCYPDNWQLSSEEGTSPQYCITLQSPESGFWLLQMFGESDDLVDIGACVLRSLRQEYEDVEVVEVRETIDATETIGYDLNFYCLDFVVSACIRSFSVQGRSCVAFYQAEDREFEQKKPVFLAITTSLLRAD